MDWYRGLCTLAHHPDGWSLDLLACAYTVSTLHHMVCSGREHVSDVPRAARRIRSFCKGSN